jgi:hemerythrin
LENHKLLHDKFTEKIYDTKKSIRDDEHLRQSDAFYSFLEGLLKFLNTWLKNHIMIKDMEYKPYIKHVL